MKILVVGSGGREHATLKSLNKNQNELYCAPGNAGIANIASCVDIKSNDIVGITNFAKENKIDLVVVSQDEPLVLGMVDELEKAGIRSFGPNKAAAIIEGSKAFSKNLMKKYNIPTAKYENFTSSKEAIAYLEKENSYPTVIKASGLALGKGVIIAQNEKEAKEAVIDMLDNSKFGESSKEIVIEEFLQGVEVSVLAFCDGKTIRPLISAKDHKRAFDNDEGLNTGGMGVIAPNPYYTKEIEKQAFEKIFTPTIEAMNKEGRKFKGVLYFGLMLTDKGPYVIEYNCRLGDPEAQVCLSLLKTDLLQIMNAVIDEKLHEVEFENSDEGAIVVMLCSGGYPLDYKKGYVINGLDEKGQNENFDFIFHSGTAKNENGQYTSNSGRVLGLVAKGENVLKAKEKLYSNIKKVNFEDCFYRSDIGGKN